MWSDVQVLESHCQKSKVGNLDKDKYAKGYMGDPTQAFNLFRLQYIRILYL
jgi:hypothetical protein